MIHKQGAQILLLFGFCSLVLFNTWRRYRCTFRRAGNAATSADAAGTALSQWIDAPPAPASRPAAAPDAPYAATHDDWGSGEGHFLGVSKGDDPSADALPALDFDSFSTKCTWHRNANVGGQCTNSGAYPSAWDEMDEANKKFFFYDTAKECCSTMGPGCVVTDECEDKECKEFDCGGKGARGEASAAGGGGEGEGGAGKAASAEAAGGAGGAGKEAEAAAAGGEGSAGKEAAAAAGEKGGPGGEAAAASAGGEGGAGGGLRGEAEAA